MFDQIMWARVSIYFCPVNLKITFLFYSLYKNHFQTYTIRYTDERKKISRCTTVCTNFKFIKCITFFFKRRNNNIPHNTIWLIKCTRQDICIKYSNTIYSAHNICWFCFYMSCWGMGNKWFWDIFTKLVSFFLFLIFLLFYSSKTLKCVPFLFYYSII